MKEIITPASTAALLSWYRTNKRDLPWRKTSDPYRIWLSEIMLQQTRVEAVKPYYARFLETCPDVATLASLPEEKLMKLWEGLGYYSRARNLQKAAKDIMNRFDGKLPPSYADLRLLCGIGDYTAGAIASIAFGIPVPAVDGNVLRVLSRLQGSDADIMLPATKKEWTEKLAAVIPKQDAGDFTQAMIELGATLCGPNCEAHCGECPMKEVCKARKEGLAATLPVRSAKKPRKIQERTVFLIRDEKKTVLSRRPAKGLLAGLYELPGTDGHLDEKGAVDFVRALGLEPLRILRLEDSKHIFTHIEWHMIAYEVIVTPDFDGFPEGKNLFLTDNKTLTESYAIPSAFGAYKKYLEMRT